MKFADPKNDLAFKKIFGDKNKTNILISFLNAILSFKDKQKIVSLSIANPYQVPKIEGLKETVLDINAVNENGEHFIVEMQVKLDYAFAKRSLFYTAKSYVGQLNKAEEYNKLAKVYFIGILDFNVFDNPHYLSTHLILDEKTHANALKDFQFNFIELPKFDIALKDCDDDSKRWIHFLQNVEDYEMIPEEYQDKQDFLDAFESAETYKWQKQELVTYDYMSMQRGIEKNALLSALEDGKKQGLEQGIEQGLEQGIEQRNIEIAKGLLDVLDDKTISLKTGLDIATIKSLRL